MNEREEAGWTCAWCGALLVPVDGVWTDEATGSGDYCPEGLAVGATGTSPHLPTLATADTAAASEGDDDVDDVPVMPAPRPRDEGMSGSADDRPMPVRQSCHDPNARCVSCGHRFSEPCHRAAPQQPVGIDRQILEAAAIRVAVLELQRERGRMAKVTVQDFLLVLGGARQLTDDALREIATTESDRD